MSKFDYSEQNIPLIRYYDSSNFGGVFSFYDQLSS